jgi:toxoflavin synthase
MISGTSLRARRERTPEANVSDAAEYDRIGDRYSEAKQQPFRLHLEAYTLERLAGDVDGLRVVDFACGDGFYTRRFKKRGAAEVIGVELSAEMVSLARRAEEVEPLGCRYRHGDAADAGDLGAFDLVVASYLFNYASTRDELRRFCEAAARSLKLGGRLLGVNDFTDDGRSDVRDFTAHGFRKIGPAPYVEGAPITYEFLLPEGRSFAITNYYWRPESYVDALKAAGFREVSWVPFEPSAESRSGFPPGFFDDLLAARPLAALQAHR